MKALFTILALAVALSAPIFAFAASPEAALQKSAALKGLIKGISKDYGVPDCDRIALRSYSAKTGEVKAETYCTFTDESGESAGVHISIEGTMLEGTLLLSNIRLNFAG